MNGLIQLDGNGHIMVNDSMSEELKEKIELYNKMGDSDIEEEELPDGDMPLDSSDEVSEDDSYDFDSDSDLLEIENQEHFDDEEDASTEEVSEEELDSLNDLFN